MPLIDVVNFNADASCLSSHKWLGCLQGGPHSLLMQMLENYVRFKRKVNLGLMGVTIKDIAFFNPEAIDFINRNQNVFELLIRPFAHDSPLLRYPEGFRYNLEQGVSTIRRYFSNINDFYLAPEIMVTGEHIMILKEMNIRGTFVHHGRYDVSMVRHIPDKPYYVYGVLNSRLHCLPFTAPNLENKRLFALHGAYDPREWCFEVQGRALNDNFFTWRDGESGLLLPLGVKYEKMIFEEEITVGLDRQFLSEITFDDQFDVTGMGNALRYFPLGSMKPWLNEMKLYWYVDRVREIERKVRTLPKAQGLVWLLTINSDIFSSVEKLDPVIAVSHDVLQVDPNNFLWEGNLPLPEEKQVILSRSERAGEGQDYLAHLDSLILGKLTPHEMLDAWRVCSEPHLMKAYARIYDEILDGDKHEVSNDGVC